MLKEGAKPRFTFDLQVDVCTRWELECTQTHTMSEVESLGAKHIAHPTSVQNLVFKHIFSGKRRFRQASRQMPMIGIDHHILHLCASLAALQLRLAACCATKAFKDKNIIFPQNAFLMYASQRGRLSRINWH